MTSQTADQVLNAQGSIVNIGQIGPELKRSLERRVRSGELIKYRGHWDTLSPDFGLGPLKTIYAKAA
jgi:hypothetical protein